MRCSAYSISSCLPRFPMTGWSPGDLEGIGKPTLKLKTEEITDGTELRFEYQSEEQALSQLSFYFTADEEILSRGRNSD